MWSRCLALTGILGLMLMALSEPAQAQKRPVQLALLTPVQIFPAEDTIAGVRLNILYGRNAAVSGLDVGLVNHTTGTLKGWQVGIVGITNGFRGWQDNYVNIDRDRFEGFQAGLVNVSESFGGFQYGIVNHTQGMSGFQLAIVNYARTMHGLQVGVLNIIKEGGAFPFFPIANWSF